MSRRTVTRWKHREDWKAALEAEEARRKEAFEVWRENHHREWRAQWEARYKAESLADIRRSIRRRRRR